MAHSVAEAAARAVKNSQRVQVETRTSEQRLADIRKNRAAKLFITPDDQDFLLETYDRVHAIMVSQTAAIRTGSETIEILGKERDDLARQLVASAAQIDGLQAQIAEMNQVAQDYAIESDLVDD